MKLISPKGIEVDVPVGGAHGPVESRLERGWTLPPPEPPRSPPIKAEDLLVEAELAARGVKIAPAIGQDDVSHAAASDPPPASC